MNRKSSVFTDHSCSIVQVWKRLYEVLLYKMSNALQYHSWTCWMRHPDRKRPKDDTFCFFPLSDGDVFQRWQTCSSRPRYYALQYTSVVDTMCTVSGPHGDTLWAKDARADVMVMMNLHQHFEENHLSSAQVSLSWPAHRWVWASHRLTLALGHGSAAWIS